MRLLIGMTISFFNIQSKTVAQTEQWSDRVHNQTCHRLHQIKQPLLVTNGVVDTMVPTENSYILAQQLPDAQLIIYPDSGHGHLFQYPRLFAEHAKFFLNALNQNNRIRKGSCGA